MKTAAFYGWNVLIISWIILFFFLFLGWLIMTRILRPIFAPVGSEATDPTFTHTRLGPLLLCLTILYGPFVAGMYWAWNSHVILRVDSSGSWTVKNPFWVTVGSLKAETPRTLEVVMAREPYHDSESEQEGFIVSAVFWLTPENKPPLRVDIPIFFFDTDADSHLLKTLGYPDFPAETQGANGGVLFPRHVFDPASGPLFLP